MRLYTVSAIEGWQVAKVKGRPDKLRLGKNGGPLAHMRGLIGSREACTAFVAQAQLDNVVSVSYIRKWRGQ